ncbi:MAG: HigA family addiction module antidote protein [Oceanospirillaceae bacterium]|nr:HigA family addiction module antidote protein [Oceanospirillaceae bacterium]
MTSTLRLPAHQPTSIGEMLTLEFLEPLDITQGNLATAMGVGRKTVNELCNNKRAITVETALILAKVLSTTPEFWINLQTLNNLWNTQHNEVLLDKLEKATVLNAA